MIATLSRRNALRSAFAFALGHSFVARAFAEGARDTIVAMGRYLGAVVGLFAGTQGRVEGIDVSAVDAETKAALQTEIQALVQALDTLLAPKTVFIGDLRGYLELARANAFDSAAHRANAWRAIQREVDEIARAAQRVLEVVRRPNSRLNVVIPDADRLELETVMMQRGLLLQRFGQIPPPHTPGELSELSIVVDRHEALRQVTQQFRVALEAKRRTLTA